MLVFVLTAACTGLVRHAVPRDRLSSPPPSWVVIHVDHPATGSSAVPAALRPVPTGGGAVLTPHEAEVVFDTLWTMRQTAFSDHDRTLMATFEAGPALEADEVTCGCAMRSVRGGVTAETLLVPHAAHFPAAFLAEADTTVQGAPYTQYLVIGRRSEASPWKVVADPGFPGKSVLNEPLTDRSGFDGVADAGSPAAPALPGALAKYWQSWTDTGRPSAGDDLAPGKWTTGFGSALARRRNGSYVRATGLVGYYRFQAGGPGEAWSFTTSTGTLTCGVVRTQAWWTSTTGVYQTPSRTNWGPTVAPGSYKAVVSTDISQPCFLRRSGAPVTVVSGLADPDTEQGVGAVRSASTGQDIAAALDPRWAAASDG